MSDSVWPHRRQPTRLPRPWDSPGKNTGVGCHFLLQCMKVKSESEVAQSNYFTILYWFCHTLTWIRHRCTCVLHPEPHSHIPPHPIPQGHPRAPAPSTLSQASNLDWRSVSHMIIYMFQCYSLKSSHPRLLPQSPKDCSIHMCLFCCLAYRIIVTIFQVLSYMIFPGEKVGVIHLYFIKVITRKRLWKIIPTVLWDIKHRWWL